jgi:branched-chain amino acid transport system ATP-binding protein
VDGLPPHKVARAGIARGFQELRLFNRLSARDNIEAAIPNQRGESIVRAMIGGLRDETQATDTRSAALLRDLTIEDQADTLAERLSYGQQKLLSLGRLLAGKGRLLLLDEPTSGLSPGMVEDFCARMRALTEAGKTILLIEHNVEIVMRLSDWIIVMHQGTKIAEGPPERVRNNVTVMHTYLGIT